MAVHREENQADVQREVVTGGQDAVQRAVKSLIPVLSWGWKAYLTPGPLKQISLPHQASRSRFLLLAPRSAAVAS